MTTTSSDGAAASLPNLLAHSREPIIDTFIAKVLEQNLVPEPLPREIMQDHLPDFLDEVLARLCDDRGRGTAGTLGELRSAREHAGLRWNKHYDLAMMIREYGVLKDAILSVARSQGVSITVEDVDVLSSWMTVGPFSYRAHPSATPARRASSARWASTWTSASANGS